MALAVATTTSQNIINAIADQAQKDRLKNSQPASMSVYHTIIQNTDSANSVYIEIFNWTGTATTASGYELKAWESFSRQVDDLEDIHVVTASGTVNLRVI